ncbi:MAG: MFS transporter [Candidatus Dojkabacteria bacterium]
MFKKHIERFNKVVILLTLSDVFAWGPFLIITAISAIYLANKLDGNVVEFVGIGTGVYFFTRAILQVPIGLLTDKMKRDKDEIFILTVGTILMGLPYIFYPQITEPMHYYILQFVFGIGVSLNLTSWRKLFAMNVDSGREGFQYALYETIISVATAMLSALVGTIASLGEVYFDIVIISAGIVMMLGSVWIILIYSVEKRKTNKLS